MYSDFVLAETAIEHENRNMISICCHSKQREESPSATSRRSLMLFGMTREQPLHHLLHQKGFSLIEVMISAMLGVFLLFGLVQVYLSVKKTYYLQHNLAQIQENGRYAIYFLNKEIRMAGYAACDHKQATVTGNFIDGYASRTTPGSNVITIQSCGYLHSEKVLKKTFYIADTQRKNAAEKHIFGLYEKKSFGPDSDSEEIVSDVSDMQIQYGIADSNQTAIATYKTTAAMTAQDWSKVRSIEIELTMDDKPWNTYIALREHSKQE